MERDIDQAELIDLGAASIETAGPFGPVVEPSLIGKLHGITDDE